METFFRKIVKHCQRFNITVKFDKYALPGLCRLIPVALLKKFDYRADVRLAVGKGDTQHFSIWCRNFGIPMAFPQHIRVKHAKGTEGQLLADPDYEAERSVQGVVPYIPEYRQLAK